ncbi:hypothetical protein N658DRAFT_526528 [Parathielavia hyrcaniae]|uniref:C2H2-type domain-containing protein n=1 Tax=Parathielavia hyrcaniae TaxID=113614 RepID=A0AAN6SZ60_9PEZI|nr:hypothetical protein N658DRAFT_526528 [Parathielavia hyrcaniae]
MGLATIVRGFKVPVAVLDRFFESNGLMPTYGFPPFYYCAGRHPGQPPEDFATEDPHSAFFRAKLAATPEGAADIHNQNTSEHAYVSYAYVMVFCQRQIDVARELPDKIPPGFSELRNEILGFANEDEQALLRVAGMQPAGGDVEGKQDRASMLFVVVTDEREYPWEGPFLHKSDRCCDECPEEFENYTSLQHHWMELHGLILPRGILADDI